MVNHIDVTCGRREIVAIDSDLHRLGWLREGIRDVGLRVIESSTDGSYRHLAALPPHRLGVVIVRAPETRGMTGVQDIRKKIADIRKHTELALIVFIDENDISSSPVQIRDGAVFASRESLDLDALMVASRERRRERNWEARNSGEHAPSIAPRIDVDRRWIPRHPTANFNVKHPSMVVPFALASKISGKDVFCEVSAQELFLLHRAEKGPIVTSVAETLDRLRRHVDLVNRSLGTRILIHLDHCNDLDMIRAACDAGVDSVMTDGSGRSLEQNIAFTTAATRIVRGYGISVEGEIGSIEGGGRWDKTRPDDFERFVDATDVDFIGVSIGQFHGFDYGFESTRAGVSKILESDREANSRDRLCLLEACLEMREAMSGRGLPIGSQQEALRELADEADDPASPASVDDLLRKHRERTTVDVAFMLDELELAWLNRRRAAAEERIGIWRSILDSHRHHRSRHGLIDHALLQDFVRRLDGTGRRIVVHGGSSISRSDLVSLPNEVARVNFGTDVFTSYLDALSENSSGVRRPSTSDYGHLVAYLEAATIGWTRWIDKPPRWLGAYARELVSRYVAPLVEERELEVNDGGF